jgi:hypothetical protein
MARGDGRPPGRDFKGAVEHMVVVISFVTDVGVLADGPEAERLAQQVIDEELERARTAILERLTAQGIDVSMR